MRASRAGQPGRPTLHLAEGIQDLLFRGVAGGEKASYAAQCCREDKTYEHDFGGDLEVEGHLGEICVAYGCGEAVEGENKQTAEETAETGQGYRFDKEADQDAASGEAQNSQRADFAGAAGYAAYIVFMAAKLDPTAITIATKTPINSMGAPCEVWRS
jgi:hypothetical protein